MLKTATKRQEYAERPILYAVLNKKGIASAPIAERNLRVDP